MEILKEKYSITELSEMLQLTDHCLRFYEKELELTIPKDDRGRRYYTAEMANIMYKIKVMRSEGLEIKAIKKILQDECLFVPLLRIILTQFLSSRYLTRIMNQLECFLMIFLSSLQIILQQKYYLLRIF